MHVASQCWCLGRLLPLMIGHIIPVDNDHWINFCLLLTIMDYLFAPTISSNAIDYLRIIIAEHHESFQQLYQNCNFIPKMHYMVHYPDWIQRYLFYFIITSNYYMYNLLELVNLFVLGV